MMVQSRGVYGESGLAHVPVDNVPVGLYVIVSYESIEVDPEQE